MLDRPEALHQRVTIVQILVQFATGVGGPLDNSERSTLQVTVQAAQAGEFERPLGTVVDGEQNPATVVTLAAIPPSHLGQSLQGRRAALIQCAETLLNGSFLCSVFLKGRTGTLVESLRYMRRQLLWPLGDN